MADIEGHSSSSMAYFHEVDLQRDTHEDKIHKPLQLPPQDNPTSPYLRPGVANIILRSPMLALGTIDQAGMLWTTIWGGELGFCRSIGDSMMFVRAIVDRTYDPVINTFLRDEAAREVTKHVEAGRVVSGLGIDLEAGKRAEVYGTVTSSTVAEMPHGIGEVLFDMEVVQSHVACPQYLKMKRIVQNPMLPRLISDQLPLPVGAVKLLARSDLFFISSTDKSIISTNHRDGPPGFVRLDTNDESTCTLVYPEYSGIRLYETLGGSSMVGLVFPDLDTGNVLYLTGSKEILMRQDAHRIVAQSNVAAKIKVNGVRFVENGLSFRISREFSLYDPPIRFFGKDSLRRNPSNEEQIYARLVAKQFLSPTIARFRFFIADPERKSRWKPGQYVTLNFENEFNPAHTQIPNQKSKELKDNYDRKFTVSSGASARSDFTHFEITVRKLGRVTERLFNWDSKDKLEVPLKGFQGEFLFNQGADERISIVARGIGITPLLAQTSCLDLDRTQVYWAVRAQDLGLALDSFEQAPGLSRSTKLFVTGEVPDQAESEIIKLKAMNTLVETRRMKVEDLQLDSASSRLVARWYICTGAGLRNSLLEWLEGRNVVFETFNH